MLLDPFFTHFNIPHLKPQKNSGTDEKFNRGNIIIANKSLQPRQIQSLCDFDFGAVNTINFRHSGVNYLLMSIYLNPNPIKRQTHIKIFKSRVEKARKHYPGHQLIVMGDYNCRANEVAQLMRCVDAPAITRFNFNHQDHTTFKRNCTRGRKGATQHTSSPDHAYAIITQPNLNFKLTINDANDYRHGIGVDLEHLVLTLTLDNVFAHGDDGEEEENEAEEEETPWVGLAHDKDLRQLHHIMKEHKMTLRALRNNTVLRKVMEESGKLAFDPTWDQFNIQVFTNNNQMANAFVSTLLNIVKTIIGQREDRRIANRKVKGMYKMAKPYQQWSKITTLFEQHVATKNRLAGLTMAQTESLICHIMATRRDRYIALWEEERRKEIKRLLKECQVQRRNGNYYEAQKYLPRVQLVSVCYDFVTIVCSLSWSTRVRFLPLGLFEFY